jgi:hypothetical protein
LTAAQAANAIRRPWTPGLSWDSAPLTMGPAAMPRKKAVLKAPTARPSRPTGAVRTAAWRPPVMKSAAPAPWKTLAPTMNA